MHKNMPKYRISTVISVAISLAGFGMAGSASAQDVVGWQAGDVVIKAGPAAVLFDGSINLDIAGTPVAGANVDLSDGYTAGAEVEYFFTDTISAALNLGIPPKGTVDGTGSLAPFGELGKVRYGIGALVARYHFNAAGRFSPYIAGGVGHFMAMNENDGAVSNLEVDNAWGPVIQGGADFHLTENIGLYANATFSPMKTDAHGIIFAAPAVAEVTLDPTVVQAGLFYRF